VIWANSPSFGNIFQVWWAGMHSVIGRGQRLIQVVMCVLGLALALCGFGAAPPQTGVSLVLAGGSGPEEAFAKEQLQEFQRLHPDIRVTYQSTPSSASERHTLYVTWLSSRSPDIDVLNLDVIWVPEFAAAGWLLPLEAPAAAGGLSLDDFLPPGLACSRYQGRLFSVPWFVDTGLLYYRQDLYAAAELPPPRTFAELLQVWKLQEKFGLPYGFLFPGQAYEGLVCVALEFIWSNGGAIFDLDGNLVLDSARNRQALETLVNLIYRDGVSPLAVATFQEEDCRHAFEEGYAVLMRNWPYAYPLLNGIRSPVAGKFGVLPLVHGPGGRPTSCFGGGCLGINAFSRHPEASWKLVQFLLARENLKKRAQVLGMLPPVMSLYEDPDLLRQFPYLMTLKDVFITARPRPITPLYSFIGELLRVHFSRAVTRQETPQEALQRGQAEIAAVLRRFGPPGEVR
jgi:multiple sugar transport system substrate-binding protein